MRARLGSLSLCLAVSLAAACGSPPPPETPAPSESATATSSLPLPSAQPSASASPAVTAAPTAPPSTASASAPSAPPAAPTENVPIRASKMIEDLKALGLDPKKLPDLDKIDLARKKKLMPLFQRSMGYASCAGCHVEGNFAQVTRAMQISSAMWKRYIVELRDDKGGPLFCDSCHAGQAKVLDRRDKKALAKFMTDEYEAKLSRADKKDFGCTTCHGEDMQMRIIARLWNIPEK